ncbi:hypothetical protein [Flavobacterium weaverense]|uniref:Uncharacterized protein n=1 Tax=Flavobacterium weaverense TaxID=271156 RepID=A0A3L9ZRX9_9FLAO|nr:hypothetical protein [Flavobacterium weaverense]RMA75047.1 hypothetical protein BC961_2396 [Flavobacterium weaverense]
MKNEEENEKRRITVEKALELFHRENESLTLEVDKKSFYNAKKNNENNQSKSSNLSILTIREVALKLKLINSEAAKKWIEKRGIRIHKFSKQNIVYEIEVICEIDKPFVKSLRLKYPLRWKKIYRNLVKDKNVYELLVLQLEGELDYVPTTKVKRNIEDEKLYNDLMK